MNRPEYLRETPRFDRSHWPQEWTTAWRVQVADLFCGRGGVGRALDEWFPRNMYFGVDIEPYGDDYPGQFIQGDLITPENRPLNPRKQGYAPTAIADLAWVSFPCTAYSSLSATEYGSAEAALEANPRITDELREWLLDNFGHYVIENVPRATYHGDLDANCRVNGLAFGDPYDLERHFETTFEVPDKYMSGDPALAVDTRENQSVRELAEAKGVPAEWGKQSVRSAIPWKFVWWIISHCPSVPCPAPKGVQRPLTEATGGVGAYLQFPDDRWGGTDVTPGDELDVAE
jgi:hypothetical protein